MESCGWVRFASATERPRRRRTGARPVPAAVRQQRAVSTDVRSAGTTEPQAWPSGGGSLTRTRTYMAEAQTRAPVARRSRTASRRSVRFHARANASLHAATRATSNTRSGVLLRRRRAPANRGTAFAPARASCAICSTFFAAASVSANERPPAGCAKPSLRRWIRISIWLQYGTRP